MSNVSNPILSDTPVTAVLPRADAFSRETVRAYAKALTDEVAYLKRELARKERFIAQALEAIPDLELVIAMRDRLPKDKP
jgi:hypothetical protein